MSAQYYNVYVGENNASGSAVISTNHSGTLESIKFEQGVVISSGLEPGDKVIVKGAAKVSTGMKVNSVEQAF